MFAGRIFRQIFARAFVSFVSTSTPGTMSSSSPHLQMVLHPYQFDPSYQFRSGFIAFTCGACTLPSWKGGHLVMVSVSRITQRLYSSKWTQDRFRQCWGSIWVTLWRQYQNSLSPYPLVTEFSHLSAHSQSTQFLGLLCLKERQECLVGLILGPTKTSWWGLPSLCHVG